MGAYTRKDRRTAAYRQDIERVYTLFPRLKERRTQHAGTMSGGEQQMLAIGRALMSRPRVLLLDEPSMGLAPKLIQQIFSIIVEINQQGTTVLLVEQNAAQALRISDVAYVLETGTVVRDGHRGRARRRRLHPRRLPRRRRLVRPARRPAGSGAPEPVGRWSPRCNGSPPRVNVQGRIAGGIFPARPGALVSGATTTSERGGHRRGGPVCFVGCVDAPRGRGSLWHDPQWRSATRAPATSTSSWSSTPPPASTRARCAPRPPRCGPGWREPWSTTRCRSSWPSSGPNPPGTPC